MCGRFAQVFQIEDLGHIERIINRALGIDQRLVELFASDYTPTYNAAPTQQASIIHSPDNKHIGVRRAHFGLIPNWSRDRSVSAKMINARSETIADKPAFRKLYRSRRCILPISGFYEWQARESQKSKQPWYIHRADNSPMLLACVWDTWPDPATDSPPIDSFSIITTRPDGFMSDLHHRMPMILEPESVGLWFNHSAESEMLEPLLSPSPQSILVAHRVSTRVNSPTNNDPELIEPDSDPGAGTLWG